MADNVDHFGESNNPYKLLGNSENVYWIALAGTDISDTLAYIRRHYNENVQCSRVSERDEIVVYCFTKQT